MVFQFLVRGKIKRFTATQRSVRYFNLRVDGFPVKGVREQELRDFIAQFGSVQRLDFILDFENALYNAFEIKETVEKIDLIKEDKELSAGDKVEDILKVYEGIRKNNVYKLAKISPDKSIYEKVGAMVLFSNNADPCEIVRRFQQAYHKNLLQRLGLQRQEIEERFLFRGKFKLRFSRQDVPENVLWQNLELTKKERARKILSVLFPIMGVILLSMSVSLVIHAITDSVNSNICIKTEVHQTLQQVRRRISDGLTAFTHAKHCFCEDQTNSLFEQLEASDEIRRFCAEEIKSGWVSYCMEFVYGFINFLSNSFIAVLLFRIIKRARSRNETENEILGIKIGLISEYINTMLTVQVLLLQFGNVNLMNLFGKHIGSFYSFSVQQ